MQWGSYSFLLAMTLTMPGVLQGSPPLEGTAKGNTLVLEGTLGGSTRMKVQFDMNPTQGPTETERKTMNANPFSWMKDRENGFNPLAKVQIQINGVFVLIPQSAFADIFDPTKAKAWKEKNAYVLAVEGGDAAASYQVKFRILPSRHRKGQYQIVERVWRHGEFPTEVWERTTYHNTRWDSDI